MLKNFMEDKRLDFDAPLLSVRRFASSSTESATESKESNPATGNFPPKRSSLPFYKSDLKSGPVRNPGVIPFIWEQSPGQPKDGPRLDRPPVAPKLPPGRILNDKEPVKPTTSVRTHRPISSSLESSNGGEKNLIEVEPEKDRESIHEEEDNFSDALDTLSRTESFFMNCSVTGLSGNTDVIEPSGSFSADPQVRDFMMGRFLPAAKAMATGAPHSSSRKPLVQAREPMRIAERAESGDHRQPIPLPYRYQANFISQHARDQEGEGEGYGYDEEEDYYDNGHLSSKACGLLPKFCLKSSFCLLNPVPGMKVPGRCLPPPPGRRIGSPQIKARHPGPLGQAEEEYSWEVVYKHKLGHGNPPQREDGSKLTGESNHLTCWSDSQTADGSSPHPHSNCGGISPYRNEPSQSPFHEGRGFLGVPKRERKGSKTDGSDSFQKDCENYWVVTPHHGSQQGSGSMSPAVERTLYVDSVHMPETPNSKSSSLDTSSDNKGIIRSADEDSEIGVQSRRIGESLVLGTHDGDALQPKVSEIVEPGSILCPERSACGVMDANNGFKLNDSNDGQLSSKEEDQVKNDADPMQSVLPPPLPNSPSESWLWRTLPSVSRNPSAQSFLGIQFQPRKQFFGASSTDPTQETCVKPSKVQRGQTRFADMLAKPLSPQSEF